MSDQNHKIDSMVMSFAQLSTALISFIVANTAVVLLANLLFPRMVVLGHHLISPFMGAVYAMSVVSMIAVGMMPVVEWLAQQRDKGLSNTQWLLLYWVTNTGAVWLVARFAEVVGLGITSWVVAVVLGFVLNLVEGALMMNIVSKVKA